MYTLKKTLKADAAHLLPNHDGKCKRLHGHSFKIVVTCIGFEKDLKDGILVDFGKIAKKYDHSYLNDFFENPTAETVAKAVFDETPFAHCVEIWESESSYLKYQGYP